MAPRWSCATGRTIQCPNLRRLLQVIDYFDDPSRTIPDLILLDRRMPRMNGDDALAILRGRGVTIPIVGITGDAQKDDLEVFLRKGATEV
jgi:CheY-like chemotaxis protein